MTLEKRLMAICEDEKKVVKFMTQLKEKLATYRPVSNNRKVNQEDVVLITYGDSLLLERKTFNNREGTETEVGNVKALEALMKAYVGDAMSAVHLLPMFTYSSDDGFSVIDYKEIHPSIGEWKDVKALSESYDLMFDAVINTSAKRVSGSRSVSTVMINMQTISSSLTMISMLLELQTKNVSSFQLI